MPQVQTNDSMGKTIVIANPKGGVAKTTSVSAFGAIYAASGNRVLMVDLDPQANLTYSYFNPGGDPPKRCVFDAIRERKDLPQEKISENLFLAPSRLDMAVVEMEMTHMKRREFILKNLLAPLKSRYDIILLDCPSSLGVLTLNAVSCADRIVVPMGADNLSYYAMCMLCRFCEECREVGLNKDARIDDIFFTRFNPQERISRSIENQIRETFGDAVLKNVTHRSVAVSEAVSEFKSVISYNPESRGAKDYVLIAEELFNRIWL